MHASEATFETSPKDPKDRAVAALLGHRALANAQDRGQPLIARISDRIYRRSKQMSVCLPATPTKSDGSLEAPSGPMSLAARRWAVRQLDGTGVGLHAS